MSSMGATSVSIACRASPTKVGLHTRPSSTSSVRRSRNGVTAILPMASRTSSILLTETLPSPAELGDGLGVARADFAGISMIGSKSRLQRNAGDDLIGRQPGLLVAGMEIAVRNAPWAARRNQQQFGIIAQQGGKGIGSGRGVDDVAAKRAAVLVGNAAGPGSRTGKQRELSRHHGMICQ